MSLLSDANTFVPQSASFESDFLQKIELTKSSLPLPECIANDIKGIMNAIERNMGINKFLFQGPPGTGKTESAKQIALYLQRELFCVDFNTIIDSHLGQTGKNIQTLFAEINSFSHPDRVIVLFDEIDALALDRTNSNDVREMGRVTSAILKQLDNLNNQIVVIATTNLFKSLDKAMARRFDAIVSFDRYTKEDLCDIAVAVTENYISMFGGVGKNIRLIRKIFNSANSLPYPGDLTNLIRSAIAFSNPDDAFDYAKRLYRDLTGLRTDDLQSLKNQGFTLREISTLSGVPKTTCARELKESLDE
jgi:SpoVK/Ycf46/Vps4 family AAA+-type ATPase